MQMRNASRQENIGNEIRQFADEEIRPRAGEFDQNEELPGNHSGGSASCKLISSFR